MREPAALRRAAPWIASVLALVQAVLLARTALDKSNTIDEGVYLACGAAAFVRGQLGGKRGNSRVEVQAQGKRLLSLPSPQN